jgi:hypothetical protein
MKIRLDIHQLTSSMQPIASIKPRYRLVPADTSATVNPKSKNELMMLPWRKAEPVPRTPKSDRNTSDLQRVQFKTQDIAPTYNIHLDKAPLIPGDCVCVFCSFRFVPKKTTPAVWLDDTYTGHDYCPICCSQGGIIRTFGIDLTKLNQIRTAVIDLIETQHQKSRLPVLSTNRINPIWDAMVTLT